MAPCTLFWFRRDLRLEDNAGLYHALRENKAVIPVFIFDTTILSRLGDREDRRVDFIHQALISMQEKLVTAGTSLQVFHGTPEAAFRHWLTEFNVKNVYTNHDYEPAARERDENIKKLLQSKNLELRTFKDQCIFEGDEVLKDNGEPYTVFTPYANKWRKTLTEFHYTSYPVKKYFRNFKKSAPSPVPTLNTLGFRETDVRLNPRAGVSDELLLHYKERRDYPAIAGTSRLSMYLRFGVLSIRQLLANALPLSAVWVNELIWRDFYMMILWHFPHSATGSFKKEYDHVPWRNDEKEFEAWCAGRTGFPIVDAGMRELNATGFMHNRVRMIVSSFLVKDLLVDWRLGEAYFAKKLNDYDMSANVGGWQWAAGSGCDAAPYFRVFNPTEQQKKFDPEMRYIRKWVPEFGTPDYPDPIVDHKMARERALSVYKKALADVRQTSLF